MKILEFYELHAITGDAQKAYSEATNEEQEMKQPTPHKHAKMIKEWVDDPSRVVEYQVDEASDTWASFKNPAFDEGINYRFADEVTPVKKEIVSSLSVSDCLMAYRDSTGHEHGVLRVADAAAKRDHAEGYQAAIDAVFAMPSKSTLSEHCLDTPTWNPENKFRFADQAPVKNKMVSSMSNEEIRAILGLKDGYYITKDVRHLADQVAKRAHAGGYEAAIDDVCAMSCGSNLGQYNFDLLRQANPFEGTWNNVNRFAAESIAKFQADVKKLLGGV